MSARASSLIGCLVGGAVGDALGLPYEGLSPRRARRLFPDQDRYHFVFGRGMFSDDTEHACMTAQALLVSGGEPKAFVRSLAWRLRWWIVGLPPAVGLATLKACLKLWLGISPARSGVFSAGNGPCMRAPLLGVAFGDRPEVLAELIRRSTRLTHTDPKAEGAARIVARAAHLAATGTIEIDRIAEILTDGTSPEWVDVVQATVKSVQAGQTTEQFAIDRKLGRGVSGYVFHTVPIVLHAWLTHPRDYAAAVRSVIRCGGDTDTTAAILGGIIGAGVGTDGIPQVWRSGLAEWPRNLRWIERLGRELAEALDDGRPRKAVPLNPAGIAARNLMFIAIVFAHVFRRMLPPY